MNIQAIARIVAAAGAAVLLLGNCASVPEGKLRLESIVRAAAGDGPRWLRDDDAGGVWVERNGRREPARAGMLLERGDVLTTRPGVAAVLRLPDGGEIAVDEGTGVRLGSLELLFGRVFADLRGLFTVRSQTVEAVNEGTRYRFEVGRDRDVRIVVADGVLTCRSPGGAWAPIRLGANRALMLGYPGKSPPRVEAGDAREVDGPLRAITAAPREGWCCRAPGAPLVRSYEDRCPGAWSASRSTAESRCQLPPPAPQGWCCPRPGNDVVRSDQDSCRGYWSAQRAYAESRCQPSSSEPPGWCCVSGRLSQVSSRERCAAMKGRYSTSKTGAQQLCKSPPK